MPQLTITEKFESHMSKLLLVEDDADFLDRLEEYLKSQRYTVDSAATGDAGLEKLKFFQYDVIVLDWNLPGINGVDLLKEFRAMGGKTPVLMLTGRDQVADKALGLDSGADDYLTKPFGVGELLARMRAVLRRAASGDDSVDEIVFESGYLHVDQAHREVSVSGNKVHLTPKEYDLLVCMIQFRNRVVTHRQLLSKVWGAEYAEDTHTLRVHIANLRTKIEKDPARPNFIHTETRIGYRFRADESS